MARSRHGLGLQTVACAAHKHRDLRRKDLDNTPYINQPIALAPMLREEGGVRNPKVIAAALQHDRIEDAETTCEELRRRFRMMIADFILVVTEFRFRVGLVGS